MSSLFILVQFLIDKLYFRHTNMIAIHIALVQYITRQQRQVNILLSGDNMHKNSICYIQKYQDFRN